MKRICFMLIFSLFSLNQLDSFGKFTNPCSATSSEQSFQHDQKKDTLLKRDQVIILGDSCLNNVHLGDIQFRFIPFIRFSDFPTYPIYKGRNARIDYSSNPTARQFRTRITNTYKSEGVNFAGHYCFVSWGCGSSCQQSALVDARTGKVYDGPFAGGGYKFQKDSRMLIVNPPDDSGWYLDIPYIIPEVHIWIEQSKRFEKR